LRLYRWRGARRDAPVLLWGHCGSAAAGSYRKLLDDLARDFASSRSMRAAMADPMAPAASASIPGSYAALSRRPLRARRRADRPQSRCSHRPAIHYARHSLNAAAFLRLGACMTADVRGASLGTFRAVRAGGVPAAGPTNLRGGSGEEPLLIARTAVGAAPGRRAKRWSTTSPAADLRCIQPADLANPHRRDLRPSHEGAGWFDRWSSPAAPRSRRPCTSRSCDDRLAQPAHFPALSGFT
jgi:hypothetical protein